MFGEQVPQPPDEEAIGMVALKELAEDKQSELDSRYDPLEGCPVGSSDDELWRCELEGFPPLPEVLQRHEEHSAWLATQQRKRELFAEEAPRRSTETEFRDSQSDSQDDRGGGVESKYEMAPSPGGDTDGEPGSPVQVCNSPILVHSGEMLDFT